MLLAVAAMSLVLFAAYQTAALTQDAQYQECTALARSNPEQAKKTAEEWARIDNTPSAHHCLAISLFALKQYAQAADALEKLSERITRKNLSLWANVLLQAARAWELHGDKARAIIVLTEAIKETATHGFTRPPIGQMAAGLLIERSRIHAEGGRDLYAIQDLDQALSLSADNEQALLRRAELFIHREAHEMAQADLHRLLQLHPAHPQATALLKKIR